MQLENLSGEHPEAQVDVCVAEASDPVAGRAHFQRVCSAALLVAFLGLLRVEKILSVPELDAKFSEWLRLVLPELGFGLLWFVAASAFELLVGKTRKTIFRIPHFVLLFAVYALAVAGHQFYRRTGTVQDAAAVIFAVSEFVGIRGVLASGIDFVFWIHTALAVVFFGLSLFSLRSQRTLRGSPLITMGICAALGLGFTRMPLVEKSVLRDLSSHFGRDMFVSTDFLLSGGGGELYNIYQKPRLENGKVERKPNIIFFVMESTRADAVGIYKLAPRPSQTPVFDKLAREGWLVERAYTTVSHTSKSLVGIYCGMYARPVMKINEAVPGQLPLHCLPHMLGDLGYRTAHFQSAGNFENRRGLLDNLGFQTGKIGTDFEDKDVRKIGYLGYDEEAMFEPMLEWVAEDDTRPFMLSVLSLSAHDPYEVATTPAAKGTALFSRYLKAVGHVDGFIGRVLERLRVAGRLDNTVIVLVGDHGEAFGEHHGRRQHDIVPYEEVVRIPMLVHAPALLGAPKRVTGLRQTLDLVPTLLDVLGVPWAGKLPGRNLREEQGHERVISWCWYTSHCMAMVDEQKKYVFHFGREPMEVFDLASDPRERVNLAEQTEPNRMRQAERSMLSMYMSTAMFYGEVVNVRPRAKTAQK